MILKFMRPVAIGATIVAAATLCLTASSAQAAKGVKKVCAGGQHTLTGEVMSVTQRNGTGSFYLRTARSHKKRGQGAGAVANAGGKNKARGEEFHVTSATRFQGSGMGGAGMGAGMGGAGRNVGFASLRRGERVQVRASGHQAETVHILGHHNTTGRRHNHYMNGSQNRYHRAGYVQRPPTKHASHHHRRR